MSDREIGKNGARQANPAFQFYPSDYLGSEAVRCMDWDEKGVYVEMLCLAWQNVGLPGDVNRVARMLRIDCARLEEMLEGPLGDCWEERDGRMFNPRMERERDRMTKISDAASAAGKKGAARRWGQKADGEAKSGPNGAANRVAMATPMGPPSDGHSEPIAPSPAQPSPTQPTTPLTPPEGGSADKPRRGKRSSALEKALASEPGLPPLVVAGAVSFERYRRSARLRAYGAQTWQQQLAKAREHPDAVIAAWQEAELKGWQGPRIDEHIAEARLPSPERGPSGPNLGGKANLQRANRDFMRRVMTGEIELDDQIPPPAELPPSSALRIVGAAGGAA